MILSRRAFAATVGLLALAGCASPDPALYTLSVVPGTVRQVPARLIELRQIGLAGYLDRPAIVLSSQGYQLALASNDRWGEPLGRMIGRILVQDLAQRLPTSTVYSDQGAITANPDMIVEIDVLRLDADADGAAVLAAEISVRPEGSHGALAARTVRLSVPPRSAAIPELVAALSAVVGQLADVVADMLSRQR